MMWIVNPSPHPCLNPWGLQCHWILNNPKWPSCSCLLCPCFSHTFLAPSFLHAHIHHKPFFVFHKSPQNIYRLVHELAAVLSLRTHTVVLSRTEIRTLCLAVDNCMRLGLCCETQPVFTSVPMQCVNHVSFAEREPRDAGADQKSSGIIRLHTIKQIIDRVRETKQQPPTWKHQGPWSLARWLIEKASTAHCCPLVSTHNLTFPFLFPSVCSGQTCRVGHHS